MTDRECLQKYTKYAITYEEDKNLYLGKYNITSTMDKMIGIIGRVPLEDMICPWCGGTCFSLWFNSLNSDHYKCNHCGRSIAFVFEKTDEELREYQQRLELQRIELKNKSIISCPYCGSTNTVKIGVAGRLLSVGLAGLGSDKIGKQWHCKKCKSNF